MGRGWEGVTVGTYVPFPETSPHPNPSPSRGGAYTHGLLGLLGARRVFGGAFVGTLGRGLGGFAFVGRFSRRCRFLAGARLDSGLGSFLSDRLGRSFFASALFGGGFS